MNKQICKKCSMNMYAINRNYYVFGCVDKNFEGSIETKISQQKFNSLIKCQLGTLISGYSYLINKQLLKDQLQDIEIGEWCPFFIEHLVFDYNKIK